jgi:hypothetical protein
VVTPANEPKELTMRAMIVYESMFGNTRTIAEAVAEGLRGSMPVEVVEVGTAPLGLPADVTLVVAGGPTHAHGLSSAKSRTDAAKRVDRVVSAGIGVREWVEGLTPPADLVLAAAFDTRIKGPELLWGSAAKGVAKRLAQQGFKLAVPPQSFAIDGPSGPPADRVPATEVEKARAWGAQLGQTVAGSAPVTVG